MRNFGLQPKHEEFVFPTAEDNKDLVVPRGSTRHILLGKVVVLESNFHSEESCKGPQETPSLRYLRKKASHWPVKGPQ